MQMSVVNRRSFIRRMSGLLAIGAFDRTAFAAVHSSGLEHPDPRPGITAEHVLTADSLGPSRKEEVLWAYEAARANPENFDGLACACGCTGKNAPHRSLLSCFESMQPTGCYGCQEEAHLVAKLINDGKRLAEIRAAIDKKWG